MVSSVAALGDVQSLDNQANTVGWSQKVLQAIQSASARTGVDFSYLVNKAAQESSFDPNAKSSSSSATGLYQFTKQTWLTMIKNYGAQYGLGNYADKISIDSDGVAHVSDPTWKKAILSLRKDPQVSAFMAGELDKLNSSQLKQDVGGKIGATELYLAHFLGAGGASDFLNEMKVNPNVEAATVLPDAASANPSVFYSADGQPKTLSQIYHHFAQRFNSSSAATALASLGTSGSGTQISSYPSYAVSSAGGVDAGTGTTGGYTPSPFSGSAQASGSSSLFSTMVLAQSNLGGIDLADFLKLPDSGYSGRKSQEATLSAMS